MLAAMSIQAKEVPSAFRCRLDAPATYSPGTACINLPREHTGQQFSRAILEAAANSVVVVPNGADNNQK